MADSTLWWVLAGSAIAVELMTGTFYLLMLALGLAAGAVTAHLGGAGSAQLVVAAVVSGGSVLGLRRYKQGLPGSAPAEANRDVNLDIGETVQVDAWTGEGTASVKYRGATWTAAPAPGYTDTAAGAHRIVEVVGSKLLVHKV
jgi:membrane protein implicated in regulation of membrane protease activity